MTQDMKGCLLIVGAVIVVTIMGVMSPPKPAEPKRPPWTEQEIYCADMLEISSHGDQYTRREKLRYCRVYIREQGGFEEPAW